MNASTASNAARSTASASSSARPAVRGSERTLAAIEEAAARLLTAEHDGVPTAPVRDLLTSPGAALAETIEAAYAVQRTVWQRRLDMTGDRIVGRKIGLTSRSVQRQLGVDQPDFGVLTDDMALTDGAEVALSRFLAPRIEGEIAIVLGRDLPHRRTTVVDVLRATEFLLPAIEIVDSRIANWDITIADTIADNASAGAFVLGATPVSPMGLDLGPRGMVLEHRGEPTASGVGADCLGAPAAAVAWLASELARRGDPLCAGEVVLAGAWGPMVPIDTPGTHLARFEGIGDVSVSFTAGEPRGQEAVA